GADVDGDDVRALPGEVDGVTASLPACGAGDQGDLALDPTCHGTLLGGWARFISPYAVACHDVSRLHPGRQGCIKPRARRPAPPRNGPPLPRGRASFQTSSDEGPDGPPD